MAKPKPEQSGSLYTAANKAFAAYKVIRHQVVDQGKVELQPARDRAKEVYKGLYALADEHADAPEEMQAEILAQFKRAWELPAEF